MTSVNITTERNTVTVNGETNVVTVATQGPQGPAFAATGTSLNDSNKVNNLSLIHISEPTRPY